ncbi:UNVERIFIED_ORG: tripartite tricarboxylate transporter TctB family protein [Burkholderia sp. CF145]
MNSGKPRVALNFARQGKDFYGGTLVFLIGAGATYKAIGYQVGSLTHMGPGYFPAAVGVLLAVMGMLIAFAPRGQINFEENVQRSPEWRGWSCIVLANVAFVVVGRYGGLIPATFAIVFIAAMGDRQNSVLGALLLATLMVLVSAGVFWGALQLQFPLIRWG